MIRRVVASRLRDAGIAPMAARQHGVVTVGQLHGAGLSKGAIEVRVRAGRLHRVHHGVYAVGHPLLSREGRFLAAVLSAGVGAVLSHRSAAELWGLLADHGGLPDVLSPLKLDPRRGLRLHWTRSLPADDRTRQRGVPVTSPARTLVDLGSTPIGDRALRRAIREALVQRLVSADCVRAELARARGRRGRARVAAILDASDGGTRSELEDRTIELFRACGFQVPHCNARVDTARGVYEVDFLFADRRLVVEADGARFHDNVLSRRRDADRQAALEAAGYRVVRLTWDQVTREPDQTSRRLRQALGSS